MFHTKPMEENTTHPSFQRLLDAARAIEPDVNQTEIAAWIDATPQSANNWKRRGVSAEASLRFAAVKGINPVYVFEGIGTELLDSVSSNETPDGYVRLEQIDGVAGMGGPVINQDFPEVVNILEVSEHEVRKKVGFLPAPGRVKLMTGRGDSLPGVLESGEVAWVDTSITHFDGDGVYLINTGHGAQFKILQARDQLYVVSTNKAYPDFPAPEEMIIGGRVLVNVSIKRMI